MDILFVFVGKTKEGFIREGLEKYAALIRRHVPVEVREIKGVKGGDPRAVVEAEADSILGRLAAGDCLVALDERGREFDSAGFARKLGKLLDGGRRPVFVIGGPFGLSGRVRERADTLVSLSKFTFTHEMARLILAEQVYRALTIIKGMTYHY